MCQCTDDASSFVFQSGERVKIGGEGEGCPDC